MLLRDVRFDLHGRKKTLHREAAMSHRNAA